MAGKYRLYFFSNRSTPVVKSKGEDPPKATTATGKLVRSRPSTDEEERVLNRGDWLRKDSSGRGPSDSKYRGKGSNHMGPGGSNKRGKPA